MKLLNLYIENYGKLSKIEYSFNNNLTVFLQENGYGKTTIASFIKAMFYGLPKASSVKFNDRVHFYPFNGGKFGGNLTFESQGNVYKIVRFFDKKSETKDEVKLYKNDVEVKDFNENIGKTFFGLKENSFAKTLFLGDNFDKDEDFSDITLKLTGLTNLGGDEDFQKAVSSLETEKKKYKLVKGNNDIISRLKNDINDLKESIKGLEAIQRGIGEKYEQKKVLSEISLAKNEKLKGLSKIKADNENYKTYQGYLQEVENSKIELENIKSKYPNGIIPDSEITALNALSSELEKLEFSKKLLSFSEEKERKLQEYSKAFESGVLTENDFNNIRQDIDYVTAKNSEVLTTKNNNYPLIVLGVILLVLGACFISMQTVISVILMVLGLAFSGAFVYLRLKGNKVAKNNEEALKIYNQKKDKLQAFFSKYNVYTGDFLSSYTELKSRAKEYISLLEDKKIFTQNLQEIDNKISEIKLSISDIFTKYNLVKLDDLKGRISALSKDVNDYKEAVKKYDINLKKASDFKRERNVLVAPCEGGDNYEILAGELDDINRKIAFIDGEIREDENLLESLPEKRSLLEELEDKLLKYSEKHKDLSRALDFLLGAEKSLKDKYVAPLKTTFVHYSEKLEKALNEKVIISSDFKMHFESGGEVRSSEHLSQGQKVLVDLCIRLALIDNMFEKESPFILLDDPFATLDDEHIKKAKVLLEELAKDKQIIYFTCHSSRA